MALDMTSLEALNGIFTLLSAVVNQLDDKESTVRVEGDDGAIVSLLKGLVETNGAEQVGLAGEQLTQLSKGVIAVKDAGISDIREVADAIMTLGVALKAFSVDNNIMANIDNMLKTLVALSKLDLTPVAEFVNKLKIDNPGDALKNMTAMNITFISLNNAANLDVDNIVKVFSKLKENKNLATSIADFVIALNKSLKDVLPISVESAKAVGLILGGITGVALMNMLKLMFTLNPISAKIVGKAIGRFISEIVKAIPLDKLSKDYEALGKLLSGITGIVSLKFSSLVWKLNPLYARFVGELIGGFITKIIEAIDQKQIDEHVGELGKLLEPIVKFGSADSKVFNIKKLRKNLSEENALIVGNFLKELLDGIPKEKEKVDNLKIAVDALSSFEKISILNVIAIVFLGKMLKPQYGENIAGFIDKLCGTTVNAVKVKATADLIKEFSNAMMKIVVCVAILAILITILPLSSLLIVVGIMLLIVNFAKKTVEKLANIDLNESKDAMGIAKSVSILIATLTISVAILAIVSKVTSFADMLIAVAVLAAVVIGAKWLISSLSGKEIGLGLKDAENAIFAISVMLLSLSISVAIITSVVSNNSIADVLVGIVVILAISYAMVGIIKLLSKIKDKDLSQSIYALVAITLCFTIIALVAKTILPEIGDNAGPIALGALITIGIIGIMLLIVWGLSAIKGDNLSKSIFALVAITLCFTIIALVAKTILVPIGEDAKEALYGAGIISGILAIMLGVIWGLSAIKGENLVRSMIALGVVTLSLLIISLITKEILIPIGKDHENALIGAGIVVALLGILITGVYLLSKIKEKALTESLITVGVVALILLITSLIVKEILIPIGLLHDNAIWGAGIVLSIIGIFGLMVWGLGSIDKAKLAQGLLVMAGIGVIILLLGIFLPPFMRLALEVGEKGWDGLIGAAIIDATLVAIGGIVWLLGGKLSKQLDEKTILKGGLLLAGFAAITGLIGLCMTPFIRLAIEAGKNHDDLVTGEANIGLILAAVAGITLILGTIGANPFIWIALGITAALGAGLLLVLLEVTGISKLYMDLVKSVKNLKSADITNTNTNMSLMFTGISTMLEKIPFVPLFTGMKLSDITNVMLSVKKIAIIFDEITKIVKNLDINTFNKIIVGENGLIDTITSIVNKLRSIGILGAIGARIITSLIKPILDTVSYFIDVIKKVATMTYISGYDERGKPIFDHLNPSVFKTAAIAVSEGFSKFIEELNTGFSKLSLSSLIVIKLIGKSLDPIVNTVSKFVDIVKKVATLLIVNGYDNNGKPTFERLDPSVFTSAATAVSTGFSNFITELNKGFEALSFRSILVIKSIGKVMDPVMKSLAMFVDTVIKVATLQIIKGYDKDGHPEYETVRPEIFNTAAEKVCTSFNTFLTNLDTSLGSLDKAKLNALKTLSKTIAPIMEGVASFVDAICNLATCLYINGYDENGRPIYKHVTDDQINNAANIAATTFANFITNLTEAFNKADGNVKKCLKAISGNIEPVMSSVGTFVDAIIQLASNTVMLPTGKYDKDGNPILEPKILKQDWYKQSAVTIANAFSSFIKTLIDNFKGMEGDIEDVLESMSSIEPIMKSVKLFADTLQPFLGLTSNKKNTKPGKDDYLCLSPDFISTISTNVANAFVTFVDTIVSAISSTEMIEKYETAKETAPKILDTLKAIETSAKRMRTIINSLSDDKKNAISGDKVCAEFFKMLNGLVTGIDPTSYDYQGAQIIWSEQIVPMLKTVEDTARSLRRVLNFITPPDEKVKYIDIVNDFNKVINLITGNIVNVDTRIKDIDFENVRCMIDAYYHIAQKLVMISNMMVQATDLQSGVDIFVDNLNRLTSNDMNNKLIQSGGTLKAYQVQLNSFTVQIQETTLVTVAYVSELENARKALEALDDLIIKKEKERNKALETFAEKIEDIAKAVDKVKKAFDNLDENKILSQFDNVKKLIQSINAPDDNQSNTQNNNQQTTTQLAKPSATVKQPGDKAQKQQLAQHNQSPLASKGPQQTKVEFYLNGQPAWSGFMKTSD